MFGHDVGGFTVVWHLGTVVLKFSCFWQCWCSTWKGAVTEQKSPKAPRFPMKKGKEATSLFSSRYSCFWNRDPWSQKAFTNTALRKQSLVTEKVETWSWGFRPQSYEKMNGKILPSPAEPSLFLKSELKALLLKSSSSSNNCLVDERAKWIDPWKAEINIAKRFWPHNNIQKKKSINVASW